MPYRAKKPCGYPLCPELVSGPGMCPKHRREAWRNRPSAAARGYDRQWRKIRLAVLERDGYACRWCGAPAAEVDHLLPRGHPERDTLEQMVASCHACNHKRGSAEGGSAPRRG